MLFSYELKVNVFLKSGQFFKDIFIKKFFDVNTYEQVMIEAEKEYSKINTIIQESDSNSIIFLGEFNRTNGSKLLTKIEDISSLQFYLDYN